MAISQDLEAGCHNFAYTGEVTITDPSMTRFTITLHQVPLQLDIR